MIHRAILLFIFFLWCSLSFSTLKFGVERRNNSTDIPHSTSARLKNKLLFVKNLACEKLMSISLEWSDDRILKLESHNIMQCVVSAVRSVLYMIIQLSRIRVLFIEDLWFGFVIELR